MIDLKQDFFLLTTGISGCLLTYILSNYGVHTVIASGFTGIIAGLFINKYAGIAFAGSFAGMSSTEFLLNPFSALILGILVFVIYKLLEKHLIGYGGKLGTIAFFSAIILIIALILTGYDYQLLRQELLSEVNIIFILSAPPLNILAIYLTIKFSSYCRKLKQGANVFSSGLTGLLSVITHFINPLLPFSIYSASFAGMSDEKIIKNKKDYIITGLILTGLFPLLLIILPGLGGKLGFIALIAVIINKRINTK